MCHFSRENAHLPANCINQIKGNAWRKKKYSAILYHYIAFYMTTYMSKGTAERNIFISAVKEKTPLAPVCCPGIRGILELLEGTFFQLQDSADQAAYPNFLQQFSIPCPLPPLQLICLQWSRQQKTACKREWSAEWSLQCLGGFVEILCKLEFSFGLDLIWI